MVCSYKGVQATCRQRIKYCMATNFKMIQHGACWRAHQLVTGDCPICKEMCSLEAAGCNPSTTHTSTSTVTVTTTISTTTTSTTITTTTTTPEMRQVVVFDMELEKVDTSRWKKHPEEREKIAKEIKKSVSKKLGKSAKRAEEEDDVKVVFDGKVNKRVHVKVIPPEDTTAEEMLKDVKHIEKTGALGTVHISHVKKPHIIKEVVPTYSWEELEMENMEHFWGKIGHFFAACGGAIQRFFASCWEGLKHFGALCWEGLKAVGRGLLVIMPFALIGIGVLLLLGALAFGIRQACLKYKEREKVSTRTMMAQETLPAPATGKAKAKGKAKSKSKSKAKAKAIATVDAAGHSISEIAQAVRQGASAGAGVGLSHSGSGDSNSTPPEAVRLLSDIEPVLGSETLPSPKRKHFTKNPSMPSLREEETSGGDGGEEEVWSEGVGAPEPNFQEEWFFVDNTRLKASSKGLVHRKSKKFEDVCDARTTWGERIKGVDCGDGWVLLPSRNEYLPMSLSNVTVLLRVTDIREASKESTANEEEIFVTDNSKLKAQSEGLVHRKSKDLDDVIDERTKWGERVKGVDCHDGWIHIPATGHYLPTRVCRVPVLMKVKPNGEVVPVNAAVSIASPSSSKGSSSAPSAKPPTTGIKEVFIFDNSKLQAKTGGMRHRRSKDDHDLAVTGSRWGDRIQGVDCGDGWIYVPDSETYLPVNVRGHQVMVKQ